MAKTVKKVDFKKVAKMEISGKIKEFVEGLGMTVKDGSTYGFTEGTLVISGEKTDIQIKLISPKSGIDRYEEVLED